jgi:hypothetical protein
MPYNQTESIFKKALKHGPLNDCRLLPARLIVRFPFNVVAVRLDPGWAAEI